MRGGFPSRVLLVAAKHKHLGGGFRSFMNIACGLKDHGVDVRCIIDRTDFPVSGLKEKQIPFHQVTMQFHGFKRFWRILWRELTVWWIIKRFRPDIIHLNGLSIFRMISLSAFWFRTPKFIHVRIPVETDLLTWSLGKARHSVGLIFVSEAIRRDHDAWLSAHRDTITAFVIHNAVDLDRFGWKKPVLSCKKSIGMVANIVPFKRVEVFIETAALLKDYDDDLDFWLAGDTSMAPAYYKAMQQKILDSGLEGNCFRILGKRSDIPALIAGSFALVHPAQQEAFGLVVIEALSIGRPVLVAGDAGPAEILAPLDKSYIIEPATPDNFAARLKLLLKEDFADYVDRSQYLSDCVAQRYAIDEHVKALIDTYRAVMLSVP